MLTRDELISEIQSKFTPSCPNGMLLGWDRNRFYDLISSLFVGYKVINQTDFNYSYCNSFDIEIGRSPIGQIYVLTIKISFIVDAYTVHVTEYSRDRNRAKLVQGEEVPETKHKIEKIKRLMEQKGFQEINDEFNDIVSGVELELAEEATIGKCLFDDF
ncbi:MAG: hypothetical protein M8364_15085 [Methylobacter sp.]|uniref:hypothetical protein n=1 Tax=Methylobacter sp. TaxID=2051955 RepID=UPI002584A3BA|nr:hypothetical protein [Methylobacter sp.]MCL7422221.1 hypothetical protein [Methylobacter sp.]